MNFNAREFMLDISFFFVTLIVINSQNDNIQKSKETL